MHTYVYPSEMASLIKIKVIFRANLDGESTKNDPMDY